MNVLDRRPPVPLGPSSQNSWMVSEGAVSLVRDLAAPRPATLADGERTVTVDLARTAILVVDMQNDFCHAEGWLAHAGVDVSPARTPIPALHALLPALRDADVPVVWVSWGNRRDRANLPPSVLHVYNRDGRSTGIGDALPGTGAAVLQAGSWSAAVVDELAPEPADIVVEKFRMSGFPDTPLDSILRNLGVKTLLFAGVNADQCVYATLIDAVSLGYDAVLVEDCCATTSPAYCLDATLYNVRQCYGFVCTSGDLRKTLEAPE